ncbi:hypothetical protein K439DRAFT_1662322 [Ramaria rubella]|nr:hypothetical protein K439DRAFT_1662322 [Ramaria rubella]
MMYFFPVIALITSLAALSLPHSNVKRTVAQIEADLDDLTTDLTSLSDAVSAANPSAVTLMEFTSIVTNALLVGFDLNELAIDTANTPGPVDVVDAASILLTCQNLQASAVTALGNFAGLKTALQAVLPGSAGIAALFKVNVVFLQTLNSLFDDSAAALLNIAPLSSKSGGEAVQAAVDTAFTSAITAFNTT